MMQKVDMMAADLLAAGLITDPLIDEPFRTRLARLFESLGEEEFLAYGRSWRDRIPGYYLLMSNPKILDAMKASSVLRSSRTPSTTCARRCPAWQPAPCPWHQDKSYWPDANSNPVITVWISLVDATLENGCLHMIPRTQHRRLLSFTAETYSGTGYLEVEDRHLNQTLKRRVRPLPVKAGTAVFSTTVSSIPRHRTTLTTSAGASTLLPPTNRTPCPSTEQGSSLVAASTRPRRDLGGLARRTPGGLADQLIAAGTVRELHPNRSSKRADYAL